MDQAWADDESEGGVSGLVLHSECLLSKWGFGDGDEDEGWMDWADANGLPYSRDWDPILRRLVREHLLPVIEQNVVVYDINTSHNPIRAETDRGDNPNITLTPESVTVPYPAVARLIAEIDGWSDEQKARIPNG